MISENDGKWKRQRCNPASQPEVAITEVAYKQNSIGLQAMQKLLIGVTP